MSVGFWSCLVFQFACFLSKSLFFLFRIISFFFVKPLITTPKCDILVSQLTQVRTFLARAIFFWERNSGIAAIKPTNQLFTTVTRHGNPSRGLLVPCSAWYALSPLTIVGPRFPCFWSHSSNLAQKSNFRIVMTSASFISNNDNSCPMQFRGPNSNGRHAPLTGYRGSSLEQSQRSGRKLSPWGQYRASRCIAWIRVQTSQPSVGYCRPSWINEIPVSPRRELESAGKSLRASLMTARVYGSWLSRWGSPRIMADVCSISTPKTVSCSSRMRSRVDGLQDSR